MGIFTDLASNSEMGPAPRVGLDRASAQQLLAKAYSYDPDVKAAFAAQDEVTRIDALTGTPSGGNYTLTVEAPVLGITYTTANIAYNADAATIEAALDTASPAGVGDGDIAVTEEGTAGLSDGYCDFTASGDLAGTPVLISINTASVTGIGAAQTVTRSTPGQGDRKALQALFNLNVISGSIHNSGEAPTDWVRPASTGESRPRADLIKALARTVVKEDGKDYAYNVIAGLYTLPR